MEASFIVEEESFVVVKRLEGEILTNTKALDWNRLKNKVFLLLIKSAVCKFIWCWWPNESFSVSFNHDWNGLSGQGSFQNEVFFIAEGSYFPARVQVKYIIAIWDSAYDFTLLLNQWKLLFFQLAFMLDKSNNSVSDRFFFQQDSFSSGSSFRIWVFIFDNDQIIIGRDFFR